MNRQFTTRKDYEEALQELLMPLKKYYSPGKALVKIGYTQAHYGDRTAELEGFSRILWGLVPLWAGGGESCLDSLIAEGIANGTNPKHPEYWGEYEDSEQAYVEMAALAYGLLMTPEKVWQPLPGDAKENFQKWLWQINTHTISDNNWLFFRVLVNCGLHRVGAEYSAEQIETDLNRIDAFYLGDGWYSDGPTAQRDYYIGFAMHFYSLIYATLMEKEDPVRSSRYKERAKRFAKDFVYWFGERGEALPYGRSLTYRFAQASFWCALAFSDTQAFSWGVIKGIVNRHFRYWFSQPILDCEGKLTLGYAYPDLHVCEGYNSPQSPYWAFKSFLILALPKEHPFWQAKEEPLPKLEAVHRQIHPGMLIQRGSDGYVTAFAAGQFSAWEPVHWAEKYEKFAYSSYFGFQVPRSYCNPAQAACDSMLAFERDGMFHVRRRCREVTCEEGKIRSVWEPMEGVEVETEIVPSGRGHIRTHVIHTKTPCRALEGGFALPWKEKRELTLSCAEGWAKAEGPAGSSSLKLLEGNGKGETQFCEGNVNLLYPKTVLPYLKYELPAGTAVIRVYVEGIPGNAGTWD